MKKLFLLITLAIASFSAQAQTYQLLNHHNLGNYFVWFSSLTELNNGNVAAGFQLKNTYPLGVHPLHDDLGLCFLNVLLDEAQVLDSVIIHDNYIRCSKHLLAPNPNGEGYILARIKSELNRDNLNISWLDENLTSTAEVTVPLEEPADDYTHFCLGGNNDIVLANPVHELDGAVFARYNLDGTLKNQVFYHDTICPIRRGLAGSRMKVWSEERSEYMVCGKTGRPLNDRNYSYWLLDSTLRIIDSATIHPNPTGIHFYASEDNDIEKLDEETYLFATHFWGVQNGILVSKRDRATQVDLKKLHFKKNGTADQEIIGLCKSNDGNFYLVYKETTYLKVVKFDPDLNILWQRAYYFIDTPITISHQLTTLKSGGLVVGGTLVYDQTNLQIFIIIINDDGTSGTPETEAFLRPYMLYPNPAQDQIHLQFSPDVQPVQIEFYDLQGRLVHMQNQSLETIDLQGLTAGSYLMKVTFEDGKSYTDKMLKE